MIEISCHASDYILRRVMELAIRHGARTARPGEFTLRAFLAGKMDLSQAEAVADVIASDNRAAHDLAFRQMRGGYSDEFGQLRENSYTSYLYSSWNWTSAKKTWSLPIGNNCSKY